MVPAAFLDKKLAELEHALIEAIVYYAVPEMALTLRCGGRVTGFVIRMILQI
jgi:hypothetical protein